ncbi:MFS transporter [Lacticaseibacillus sharpeae]|uniref:Permease of the major facilitator superfamily protein n=1 Tax=Lacticaseibacillus sharpeae JCM 1186 = DSM 20505 TaxID=1291052 RepID=A0A0R1ZJ88_9LACO|nr:MFS transporter [Lacticaseibacillus sharpeae]KRM54941.1 permease of the major facilitator superfamily protein [Lacticaseibacillus sharpeae JCM 1186 = DSM 20505]
MESSLRRQSGLITGVGIAWLFDAMDVGLLSFIIAQIEGEWHLSAGAVGMIGSVSSLGMAIGAVLFGALADRIGRKSVLLITLLIFSLGSFASAFATGYAMFIALRLIIGAGLGGELPVASTLVSESVPVQHRGRSVVLLESFWAAGWLVSALVAYFIMPQWGWRIALVLTGATALYGLYFREGLQESPVFAAEGAKQKKPFFKALAEMWNAKHWRSTAMLWVVWFMVVFSYYGMFLWLPSVMVLKGFTLIHSFGYVLIMTIAQLPGYFTAAWIIEKIGRKLTLSIFLIGTAITAFGFGMANGVVALVVWGALLSFFDLGAWGALYAYSPEQYPADVRSTGSGMAAGIGRIGGIVGPLLVGNLIAGGVGFPVIFGIFAISLLVAVAAIATWGVETQGKQLD